MVIEESDSPLDIVPNSEEVELGLTTIFEEESQDEPVVPIETTIEEEEETDRLDSQELNELQEYLNNQCGKEILQLKSNAIP